MTTLNDLYDFAEGNGIDVDLMMLHSAEALSVEITSDLSAVCMDPCKLHGEMDEKMKLCHELGHCATGAFYHPWCPYEFRQRQEHRAKVWSFKKMVPLKDLKKAIRNRIDTPWDLAAYFNVPEDFMREAIAYYKSAGEV